MKKNITINLYGALFAIDDDAYALLEKYLNETKRYFMSRDDGEEIADDIEHRVAELLSEIKADGKEVITLTDIESIIRRIGNPEEMDTEATENQHEHTDEREHQTEQSSEVPPETPHVTPPNHNPNRTKQRKLYRNPDDQLLGGVLSGLCCFFGGSDPLPLRLIFVILTLASFQILTVIYIILWAILPMARTPEDRLRMKGQEVSMQNINEEIMTEGRNNDPYKQSGKKSFIRELSDVLLVILVFCIKASVLIVILPFIITTAICIFLWACTVFVGFDTLQLMDFGGFDWLSFKEIMSIQPSVRWQIGLVLLFAIIFWGNLLYITIRSFFHSSAANPMNSRSRKILIWTTFLSGLLSVILTVSANFHFDKAKDIYEIRSNTVNGVYLKKGQREKLAQSGWIISTYKNCNPNGKLFYSCSSLTDDDKYERTMTFKQGKGEKPMQVHLKRSLYYPEGQYRMEAVVSSKGPGAYVYAQAENDSMKFAALPVDDANNYGNMKYFYEKDDDDDVLKSDYADNNTLRSFIPHVAKYWSYVQTAPFYHKGGLITTGITNIGSLVHQNELECPTTKISVYDLRIIPYATTGKGHLKANGKDSEKSKKSKKQR